MLIVMQFDAIRDDEVDEAAEERKGCLRGGLQLILFLLVPLVVLVALIPTLLSMDGGADGTGFDQQGAEPARVSFERWSRVGSVRRFWRRSRSAIRSTESRCRLSVLRSTAGCYVCCQSGA